MRVRTEDVAAEALLLAGGARAILLQLANPAVGHGVAEHSDFARRPLDRLTGTLTYLYVVAYGTPTEISQIARQVGAAHAPVHSDGHARDGADAGGDGHVASLDSDSFDGSYDARDAELQLWVAATLYEGAVCMRELVFGPLSDTAGQVLLDQGAAIATTLGVPRSLWPATTADFAAYWSRCESELRVDDVARGVVAALLFPKAGPWWLRVVMPPVRLLTAGLLSPQLRAAYNLPLNERRFLRAVRLLRAVYPRLPRALRHAPKRHYLRKFRAGQHP